MPVSFWTPEANERLRTLVNQGHSDADIGRHFGRSELAITKHRQVTGIRQPTTARMINEQPWEPEPGMLKRRCERCSYWFATPRAAQRGRCPECSGMEA